MAQTISEFGVFQGGFDVFHGIIEGSAKTTQDPRDLRRDIKPSLLAFFQDSVIVLTLSLDP